MKNLKNIREAKGYTQKEFATICKISPSTYNQYETGRRQPDIQTMELIADKLETTIDQIFGRKKGIKIPVLGSVAAGIPISAIQDILDYEEITEEMAAKGEYFGRASKETPCLPCFQTAIPS